MKRSEISDIQARYPAVADITWRFEGNGGRGWIYSVVTVNGHIGEGSTVDAAIRAAYVSTTVEWAWTATQAQLDKFAAECFRD